MEDGQKVAALLRTQLAGRTVFVTTSWDDGLRSDLRLVELGQKHRIPMMLFASPAHTNGKSMTSAELRDVARVVEIGSHTLTHVAIDNCDRAAARERVSAGRSVLEDTLGRPVPHFALVGGRYTSANLQEISPLVSSVRSTHAFNFHRPQGGLIKPSLQIRFDGRTHPLKMLWEAYSRLSLPQALRVVFRIASGEGQHDMLSAVPSLCGSHDIYLHLWGHSADVDRCGAWDALECLFSVLRATQMIPVTYSQFLDGQDRQPAGTLGTTVSGPA